MADTNLILGDCLEAMQKLPAATFDVVVTSPPYNLGIQYNTFKDTSSRGDYLSWCRDWVSGVKRLLNDEGSFFLNVGSAPANPLMPHQLILALCDGPEPLFTLQNTFHWIKSISVETRDGSQISAGHFKPINSQRFVNDCHEYIFHLTKTGNVTLDRRAAGVPYVHKSNIARWGHTGGQDLRCRGNNWFIPYETIQQRDKERPHPATFPVALVEQCVRIHGLAETTRLFDPFLGIGSSALAAQRMHLAHFTGIELDPHYLQIAKERLAAAKTAADSDLFGAP